MLLLSLIAREVDDICLITHCTHRYEHGTTGYEVVLLSDASTTSERYV